MADLGEFRLTNSFVSGADIMKEKDKEVHPLSTNNDAKAILDKMVIQSTAIEVRVSSLISNLLFHRGRKEEEEVWVWRERGMRGGRGMEKWREREVWKGEEGEVWRSGGRGRRGGRRERYRGVREREVGRERYGGVEGEGSMEYGSMYM